MTRTESPLPQSQERQSHIKNINLTVSDQAIAERASQLWHNEGQIAGNDKWYWYQAEEELERELQDEISNLILALHYSRKPRNVAGGRIRNSAIRCGTVR